MKLTGFIVPFAAILAMMRCTVAAQDAEEVGPMVNPKTATYIAISPDCRNAAIAHEVDNLLNVALLAQRKSLQRYHDVVAMSVSGDHMALIARAGGSTVVELDGGAWTHRPDAYVESRAGMLFSPDSKHFAYVAEEGHDWFVFLDDVKGPASTDPPTDLQFSLDSRRFVYVISTHGGKQVVIDGQTTETFAAVKELTFSADGKHFAFLASTGKDQWLAVVDGKKGKTYADVEDLQISSDGGRVVYLAVTSPDPYAIEPYVVVDNEKESEVYQRIDAGPLLSANGAHWFCQAQKVVRRPPPGAPTTKPSSGWRDGGPVVIDVRTRRVPIIDNKEAPMPPSRWLDAAYSPDGSRLALTDLWAGFPVLGPAPPTDLFVRLLVNDRPSATVASEIGGIIFSPDSSRIGCYMRSPREDHGPPTDYRSAACIDGQVGPLYDDIGPVIFSPDSKHVAYAAMKQNTWIMIFDGIELPDFELLRPTFDGKTDAPWNTVHVPQIRLGSEEILEKKYVPPDRSVPLPYCFDSDNRLHFIGIRDGKLFRVSQ